MCLYVGLGIHVLTSIWILILTSGGSELCHSDIRQSSLILGPVYLSKLHSMDSCDRNNRALVEEILFHLLPLQAC